MDSKQIKEEMLTIEWEVGGANGVFPKGESWCIATTHGVLSKVHAHAITSAVNGTFLQGIDPCKVKEMYDALQMLESRINYVPQGEGYVIAISINDFESVQKLLNAAKLTA